MSELIGRESAAREITILVGRQRLTTLIGAGGVGKTRLALDVAARLSSQFDDDVSVVQLAAVGSVGDALAVLPVGATSVDAFVDAVGASRALIVLDNCEHVIDEAREFVSEVLRRCPGVTILATSRQRLSLRGEAVRTVTPLALRPSAIRRSGWHEPSDAARLFLGRAGLVVPDDEVTDLDAVEDVCALLGGIPLAIELAAARLALLSVGELRARLRTSVRMLADARTADGVRQASLWNSIAWSYDLCSVEEQRVWRALSIFSAPLSLDDIESLIVEIVGGAVDPLELVSDLVDKSVLVRLGGRSSSFTLLESLKEYGRTQAEESSEIDAFQRLRLEWCRSLALRAEVNWMSDQQASLSAQLARSLPDLRLAVAWGVTHPDAIDSILDLLLAAWRPLVETQGRIADLLSWLDAVLARLRRPMGRAAVTAHIVHAYLTGMARGLDAARPRFALARGLADEIGYADAVVYAEAAEAILSPVEEAHVALLEDAIERGSSGEHGITVSGMRISLILVHDQLGHVGEADVLLSEWMRRSTLSGERNEQMFVLTGLAITAFLRRDMDRAADLASRALALAEGEDPSLAVSMNLETLAAVAEARGDRIGAARLLGVADEVARVVGGRDTVLEEVSIDRPRLEERLREELGTEGFARPYLDGADAARRDAFAATRVIAPAAPERRTHPLDGLTRRELEIHDLVAEGLTNAEIAQSLTVSMRTVEWHVQNILMKRGFTSRVQIVLWKRGAET
ncbi:ATP-binding protein [Microbacterium sp. NPDC057944]|uniref:ATP-binding protein n=1 Tax=Microbacterium sp. NPDC057944 TaxID=3346286 RepID=UPI0036D8E6E2